MKTHTTTLLRLLPTLFAACLLTACAVSARDATPGTFVVREVTVDGLVRKYQVFVPGRTQGASLR